MMAARRLIALVATLGCASAQLLPRCPNYQTTVNFTAQFAEQMQTRTGGYIVRFSNGATDACQRLHFVDGNDFNVTFIDVANYVRNYTNRYTMETASSTSPAKLHLSMHPRLFGADNEGSLALFPLIAREDLVAFVSCIERGLGLFITEQVLVFTPYESRTNLTDGQIKSLLNHYSVPRLDELKNISTVCVPKAPAAPHPLSLDLYNLVSNLMNPFGGVSNLAVTYGSPDQDPVDAAEQVMSVFREAGVSPAQFYAQTGSTVMQNRPVIETQSYFDALQKVSNAVKNPMYSNAKPTYHDNVIRVAPLAANAEHFYNYVPGYPMKYQHLNTNSQIPASSLGAESNVMPIGIASHAAYHGFGGSADQYATGNVHNPTGSVDGPSESSYYHAGNGHNIHNIPARDRYHNNNFYRVQQTPTGYGPSHYNYN